jgi:hypothetical protein
MELDKEINIICFLTTRPTRDFHDFCVELQKIYEGEVYICIDDNSYNIPYCNPYYDNVVAIIKIDNKECQEAGFKHLVDHIKIINNEVCARDKALYYFCKKYNKNIKRLWLIEEDVFIPLTSTISIIDQKYPNGDLLCKEKIFFDGIDEWYWSYYLVQQTKKLQINPPYCRGMVCAVRISKKFLKCIEDFADKHKQFYHDEVFFNTLALKNNLDVVLAKELDTIEWRKEWNYEDIQTSHLYHPIKDMNAQTEFHRKLKNK